MWIPQASGINRFRVDAVTSLTASYNRFCPAGGVPSVINGVVDTCSGTGYDDNSSDGAQNAAPLPAVVALVLALAMAGCGLRAVRR